MKELIKTLVEAWGPSGFEHRVRALIRDEVASLADDLRVDALGNLICRVGEASEGGLRVMVAAHMDEIGLMVSHVDRQGYLRFTNIGGVMTRNLNGGRVQFEDGTIGVLGMEATRNRSTLAPLDQFYADVSTGTEDDPTVGVGDPAIFWRTMDERGDLLIAKSMDDRIGCAVAIEAMRRIAGTESPHEITFVFTVQEEVGLRGATTAGYGINPDFAIALDVTPTGDVPKSDWKSGVELGAGTAIKAMDSRHIVPQGVKNLLIEAAESNDIAYQIEILTGGSTDAAAIQLAQSGIPAGTISIPCRYVHSPSETVHIKDVEASVDLLVAVLSNPITGVRPE